MNSDIASSINEVLAGGVAPTTYPTYSTALLLPALSLVVIILDIPPLIWHFSNRNTPGWSLIFWVLLLNLFNLINALIWPNDDIVTWWHGNMLCDIEVRLQVASEIALPGSIICIMRGLAAIFDTANTTVIPTERDRTLKRWTELTLCWLLPLFITAISFIMQPGRYFILAISGCNLPLSPTWVTLLIFRIWPPVLILIAAIYACLVTYRLHRYRLRFTSLLSSAHTNKARFLRLFTMALIIILGILPFQLLILVDFLSNPLSPFHWSEIHPPTWSALIWKIPTHGAVVSDRWLSITVSFLVFLLFGTGADAAGLYRGWLVNMGLGRAFPSLLQSTSRTSTAASSKFSLSCVSSKAKSLFGSTASSSHEEKSIVSPTSSTRGTMPQASSIPSTPAVPTVAGLDSQSTVWVRFRTLRVGFRSPCNFTRFQSVLPETTLPTYYRSSVTLTANVPAYVSRTQPGSCFERCSAPVREPETAKTLGTWTPTSKGTVESWDEDLEAQKYGIRV